MVPSDEDFTFDPCKDFLIEEFYLVVHVYWGLRGPF